MKLSESLQETLQAIVDRIIPGDDYPSAWGAGVGTYLERQFEKDLAPFFADYCEGLTSLDAESIARFQRHFCSLSDEEKDRVLSHVEAGDVITPWSIPPTAFFKLLTDTTAEGYYSEPEQGGNRDGLSWAMIGFENS